jgi:hypothetical protein
MGDWDLVPDLHHRCEYLKQEFEELKELDGVNAAVEEPAPATRRARVA